MKLDNESIPDGTYAHLKPGDRIVGRIRDIPYYKIGNGNKNAQGQSMNLIQEMALMTKPELWFFSEIEKKLNYKDADSIGIVLLDYCNYTMSQKQSIKKAYPLLEKKNLIKRTRRNSFMVNPKLILPRDLVEAELMWNSI